MSVVLWPRQEVLQLVVPQFGSVGRVLNKSTVVEILRRIVISESGEKKLRFETWLLVAKDLLKWNDHCIHLFWELYFQAMIYLDPDFVKYSKEELKTDIECFSIFLLLHSVEQSMSKSSNHNNSTQYDSVWPLNSESDVFAASSVNSPASPVKENGSLRSSGRSPAGSPLSPRSPRHAANATQPGSPKRSTLLNTPRTPRGSTHYLHSVRQKVPIIMQVLNNDCNGNSELCEEKNEFFVSRKMVDALGLIICGGYSRDQSVIPLSSLYPSWAAENDKSMREDVGSGLLISSNEFFGWINAHLSMNDVVYPVTVSSNFGSISSPPVKEFSNIQNDFDGNKDSRHNQPIKVINSVASLSRFSPTVICSNNTTVIHLVGNSSNRSSSLRRIGSRSFDMVGTQNNAEKEIRLGQSLKPGQISNLESFDANETENDFGISGDYVVETENSSSPSSPTNFRSKSLHNKERTQNIESTINDMNEVTELNRSNDDNDTSKLDVNLDAKFKDMLLQDSNSSTPSKQVPTSFSNTNRPEFSLPQLFINYSSKSHLYLISPYYCASIVGCSNTEIIIGAVYGTVIVSGCDRIKLSVACRKLILVNCVDCEFAVATLSPTIIEGDCRNNVIGPHNVAYRNLLSHLKQAELTGLVSEKSFSNGSDSSNQWAKLCDINICFEASNTLSLISDSHGGICEPYSQHSVSKAKLMPHAQFRVVHIPNKTEFLPFEMSPIKTPSMFVEALRKLRSQEEAVKNEILSGIQHSNGSNVEPSVKYITSTAVNKKFMEWLVATDNIQQVLDLIRLDSEKVAYNH